MKLNYLVPAFIGVLSACANAQSNNPFYVGVSLGNADLDDDHYFQGLDRDDSDVAGQLFVGYQLDDVVSFELGFSGLGTYDQQSSQTDIETSFGALTFSVLGFLPVSEQFSLYGRFGVGLYGIDQDLAYITASNTLSVDDESDSAVGLIYGFGGSYRPKTIPQLSVRIGWDRNDFSVDTITVGANQRRKKDVDYEIDSLTLGATYQF